MNKRMINLCVGSLIVSLSIGAAAESALADQQGELDYSQYPVYSGDDLGLSINGNNARFRLWAPSAEVASQFLQ